MNTITYPDYIDADLVEKSLDGSDVTEAWAIGFSVSQDYDQEECLGQIFNDLRRSGILERTDYGDFKKGVKERNNAD